MAANPMQKKARNSFLLGMIISIVICFMIGAVVYLLLLAPQAKKQKQKGEEVTAYVLNQDVFSGQVITSDMLSQINVYSNTIPANYITNPDQYFIVDDEGNAIYTKIVEKDGKKEAKMYVTDEKNVVEKEGGKTKVYKTISSDEKDQNKVLIQADENTGKMYKTKINGDKVYFEQDILATVAKIALNKNTILTQGMVRASNEKMTDDLRYVEYNMLTLSTAANVGSVIDIRLTLPNGLDLIVVSKKEIKSIIGNTIGINLTEEEILMMESAIVEAYIMKGSKIYATEYIDPGFQEPLLNTYVPTDEVQKLIKASSNNIQEVAKEALVERFNEATRNNINSDVSKYFENKLENIEEGLQKEIEDAKAAREAYLNGLTSY